MRSKTPSPRSSAVRRMCSPRLLSPFRIWLWLVCTLIVGLATKRWWWRRTSSSSSSPSNAVEAEIASRDDYISHQQQTSSPLEMLSAPVRVLHRTSRTTTTAPRRRNLLRTGENGGEEEDTSVINDHDGKYLLYHDRYKQIGGGNNQRVVMWHYMKIRDEVFPDRVLLVPPFYEHFDAVRRAGQRYEHYTVPADYIFDFSHLPQGGKMIRPLATFDVAKEVGLTPENSIKFRGDEGKRYTRQEMDYATRNKKFAVYSNIPVRWYDVLNTTIRYTADLRRIAIEVIARELPPDYAAMHVRWGDNLFRLWRDGDKVNSIAMFEAALDEVLVRRRSYHGKRKMPVYVATEDPKEAAAFRSIRARYATIFNDEGVRSRVEAIESPAIQGHLRNDLLACVEVLICACARDFLGSLGSTLSHHVSDLRGNLAEMFPECDRWRREVRGIESLEADGAVTRLIDGQTGWVESEGVTVV